VALVPGATAAIINAGVDMELDTYASGFRNVWASAMAFVVLAAIGMLRLLTYSLPYTNIYFTQFTNRTPLKQQLSSSSIQARSLTTISTRQ